MFQNAKCIALGAQQKCQSTYTKIIYNCEKVLVAIVSRNLVGSQVSMWIRSKICLDLIWLVGKDNLDCLAKGHISQAQI